MTRADEQHPYALRVIQAAHAWRRAEEACEKATGDSYGPAGHAARELAAAAAALRAVLDEEPGEAVDVGREVRMLRAALLGGPLGEPFGRDYAKLPEHAQEQIDGYVEAIQEAHPALSPQPSPPARVVEPVRCVCGPAQTLGGEQPCAFCSRFPSASVAERAAGVVRLLEERGESIGDFLARLATHPAAPADATERELAIARGSYGEGWRDHGNGRDDTCIDDHADDMARRYGATRPRPTPAADVREWFSRVLRNAAERGLLVSADETGISAAIAEIGPPPAPLVERIVAGLRERAPEVRKPTPGSAVTQLARDFAAAVLTDEANRILREHGGGGGT